MNYRHAFHAGNHADVLKHAVLARVFTLLATKEKPFAVLDAHAGIGRYDLESVQATKTGEWLGGIGKMGDAFSPDVENILAPFRLVLTSMNAAGGLRHYPGSPEIFAHLARGGDRLLANELHPDDAATLRAAYGRDKRVAVIEQDAMLAVKSSLPFQERRGLVLLDPPYEALDETLRTAKTLEFGLRRFASGVFAIWYPVTTDEFAANLVATVQALNAPNMLRAELRIKAAHAHAGLAGSGLIIINPPWGLEPDLQILLPALAERLGIGSWGRGVVEWLTPPA